MDTIKCEVTREIYENGDFHIYAAKFLNSFEELSIKTDGFELCEGQKTLVGVMGTYQGQKSFICKYEEFNTSSKEAQRNLLMSIDGIKEHTADLILNSVDDINIYRTDNYPLIKGIGNKKIELIKEGLRKLDQMAIFKEVTMMIGSEFSAAVIKKVTQCIECLDNGMEEFKENPYQTLIEFNDFSFKKADKIALSMGINQDNPERLKYLVEYVVKSYEKTGNCFITRDKLKEQLEVFGLKNIDFDNNNRLEIDGDRIYTKSMFFAETNIPRHLKVLKEKKCDIDKLENYEIDTLIDDFQKLNKIKFDEYQKKAITGSVNENVSIITGSAGSGKTTLLKCVLFILKEIGYKLYLTAPTGKAARRMSEATGENATTIHRFLNESSDFYTTRNGVMIVDESSMIDTELLNDLLLSMDQSSIDFQKIIFVGDVGQLPSVQPGNVLNDIIESEQFNVFKLIKTFRQSKDSNIIDIATKIRNNNDFEYIKKSDFYAKEAITPKDYIDSILYFYDYLREKYTSLDTFYSEVQFISPVKKGDVGVESINTLIKSKYNPKENKKDIFPFTMNDKVMCTKNDKENNIFNGEFGRITNIDNTTFTVYYNELEKFVTYKKDFDIIENFILSYCSTVHKLQGSEFKYVVIILPKDSIILDSRLLYTAITRGKQTVILLSQKELTSKIVKRNNLLKRNTNLKERLIAENENT